MPAHESENIGGIVLPNVGFRFGCRKRLCRVVDSLVDSLKECSAAEEPPSKQSQRNAQDTSQSNAVCADLQDMRSSKRKCSSFFT